MVDEKIKPQKKITIYISALEIETGLQTSKEAFHLLHDDYGEVSTNLMIENKKGDRFLIEVAARLEANE